MNLRYSAAAEAHEVGDLSKAQAVAVMVAHHLFFANWQTVELAYEAGLQLAPSEALICAGRWIWIGSGSKHRRPFKHHAYRETRR
jgi:hypothetical protein